jgi:stress-induced morphogen
VRVYQFRHIRAGRHCSRGRLGALRVPTRQPARAGPAGPATIGGMSATLQKLLSVAFPDATELDVIDRTGGGDHFQVVVTAPSLNGLSLVEQHRRVYAALAEPLADGTIHELRIRTKGSP